MNQEDNITNENNTSSDAIKKDDIEAIGRRMGWRPKDEFRGPEDKWRPAEEFVERGLTELPVLRDRYRSLDERYAKDIGELKGQITELGQTLNEFREFSTKSEQRAYERAKKELEARREAAVAHADTETFKQTQAEIDALEQESIKKPVENIAPKNKPQIDPYVFQWTKENPWFETDLKLKNVATAIHVALMQENPGLSLRDNLSEVRTEIMQRYPEKFENPRRSQASSVSESSGAATSRRGKGKSFEDLPPDAKAACLKFTKQIKGFTKEEYVRQYYAGEE